MHNDNSDDTVLVVEPAVYWQINLAPFANLNAGLSYRIVTDSNNNQLSDSDLSDFSIILNAMFGRF